MYRTRVEHNIVILLPTLDVVQCNTTYIVSCINPSAKEACFTLGEKTSAAYQKKKKKIEKKKEKEKKIGLLI